MKVIFLTILCAVLTITMTTAEAYAGRCKIRAEEDVVVIESGPGVSKNSLTLFELFEAVNKSPQLFKDLKYDDTKTDEAQMFLADGEEPFLLGSLPKSSPGDKACSDKTITGYECRLLQMKNAGKYGDLSNGFQTKVLIKVPADNALLLARITNNLGCSEVETIEKSAKSAPGSVKLMPPAPAVVPAIRK